MVRNVLFCLVDIDSIPESGSCEFDDDYYDDDGDFDSDSVISTASNQDKEVQTSSNVSSLCQQSQILGKGMESCLLFL